MKSNAPDHSSPPLVPGKPCKCRRGRSQAVCKKAALFLWSCHRQLDLSNSLGDLAPIPNAHSQAPASKTVKHSRAGHGRCIQMLLYTILKQRAVTSGLDWFPLAKAIAGHVALLLLLLSWEKLVLPQNPPLPLLPHQTTLTAYAPVLGCWE